MRHLLPQGFAAGRVAAVVLLAGPTLAAGAPRAAAPPTAVIEGIELVDVAPGVRLEILLARELPWSLGRDAEGRLTIDLPNARAGLGVVSRIVPSGLVAEIRLLSVGVPSRPVTRLVVVTRERADHRVAADRGRLRLDLVPTGTTFATVAPQPVAEPPVAPPAPRTVEPLRPAEQGVGLLAAGSPPALRAIEPATAGRLLVVEPPEPPPVGAIEETDLDLPVAAAPPAAKADAVPSPSPPLAEHPIVPMLRLAPAPPAPVTISPPVPLEIASASPPSAEPVPSLAPPARSAIEPLATPPAPPLAPAPVGPPRLRKVASELFSVTRLAAGVLAVAGDGAFDYTGFRLESPARFVLDLHGVRNRVTESLLPIDEGVLVRVRVTQYRLAPAPVTRIIFDLRTPTLPAIETAADGLLVRFPASPADAGALPDASPFR